METDRVGVRRGPKAVAAYAARLEICSLTPTMSNERVRVRVCMSPGLNNIPKATSQSAGLLSDSVTRALAFIGP
jgi:hypothetical protein